MLQNLISDFTTVLTDLVPALGTSIVKLFTNLFLVTSTAAEGGATTITGLSPVGTIAVFFLAYYFCIGLLPKVMNLMKLGWSKGMAKLRARRAKKA